jgi:hypothetical protein
LEPRCRRCRGRTGRRGFALNLLFLVVPGAIGAFSLHGERLPLQFAGRLLLLLVFGFALRAHALQHRLHDE